MSYVDNSGRHTPAHIALDATGRIRAGFRRAGDVLADGERLSYDITMMDHASAGGMMMRDNAPRTLQDMANDAEAAYQRSKRSMNDWRDAPCAQTRDAVATKAPQQASMTDAERERAALAAADADHNAWRNQAPSASAAVSWSNPAFPKL